MPSPRVFVSSTCYDLQTIRENLRSFIFSLGFEPVLSDQGNVYYDTELSAEDACLEEVKNCQIFLLVIGGRYGSTYKNTGHSITNQEYKQAVKCKLPIFALVESRVNNDFIIYKRNKENLNVDVTKISYSSADSPKIFEFIEEVQKNSNNNALVPFSTYEDIEQYLRQQWASMLYSFLTHQLENKSVANLLESLTLLNERVESIAGQIIQIVGKKKGAPTLKINALIQKNQFFNLLKRYNFVISPKDILKYESLSSLLNSLKIEIRHKEKTVYLMIRQSKGVKVELTTTEGHFAQLELDYEIIRYDARNILSNYRMTVEDFLR